MDESVEEFGALFARFLRLVVEGVEEPETPVVARLRAHLGTDPLQAPLTTAPFTVLDHPDLQMAIDAYLAADGRSHDIIGHPGHHGMPLSEALLYSRGPLSAPGYIERPVDVDRQLPCLRGGIVLVTDAGAPPHALVVSVEDHGPFESITAGVLSAEREQGREVLTQLRRLMGERSVYRGKVLALTPTQGYSGHGATVRFLPRVAHDRDGIVLPDGRLERVERRTVGFDAVAERLGAQGLSRKRGVLLYGPPGTGKTLTAQYLVGRMTDRTVIVLTGQGLAAISAAATLAERLQPAMLVLEDVDLVAHDRSFTPAGNPVLFELLNALDGLGEQDRDVVVILTTNRADLLEPALAARPGRVDLAVELPLPNADERHRLLGLYTARVPHEVADWTFAVERTEGTPASFVRELIRSAAMVAAERGGDTVTADDVTAALDELLDSGPVNAALLGVRWGAGDADGVPGHGPGPGPAMWSLPAGGTFSYGAFGSAEPAVEVVEEYDP